jgi:radical SAM superfamily enzyme YgiQ (UPF0313 family)
MSKIVFIEPKAPNLHIFSKSPLPRLGAIILGTIMKNRGWEVEVIIEHLCKIDFEDIQSADLVGISTITSTAPRAYAIADRIRKQGTPVIMGGPHVTFMAEEALEHADYVIRGEGEQTLTAFIDAWETGASLASIPNLSYRADSEIRHNPLRPHLKDLDQIPFPDFSLLKMRGRGRLMGRTIPVQTSRGCPFDCSFCSVTGMFGRQYRFRSTENILAELKRYNSRRHTIFFYDDNFAANRRRAKELCEAMIRENLRFKWITQVRADVAKDEELVALMRKAGCRMVCVGFESMNEESLKAVRKRQSVKEIVQAVRVLRRHRINIHGMFVYGFDEDDWQTVRDTVTFAKKARLTASQFLILTPVPGSELYDKIRKEDRIQFRDWSLYDGHHVVFQPRRFSLFDLQRAQIFSHKKFYSLKMMVRRFFKGKWVDLAIAGYARNLIRSWPKKNRMYLRMITMLRSKKGAKISLDYKEKVSLDL